MFRVSETPKVGRKLNRSRIPNDARPKVEVTRKHVKHAQPKAKVAQEQLKIARTIPKVVKYPEKYFFTTM